MSRRASSRRRKKDEDEDDDGTNGGASIQSNGDAKRQKTGSPDPESGPSGGKKKKAEPQEEEEEEEELIIGVDLGVPRSMTYDHWLETWENRKKKHRQEKSGLLHAMKQYNEFVKGNFSSKRFFDLNHGYGTRKNRRHFTSSSRRGLDDSSDSGQ